LPYSVFYPSKKGGYPYVIYVIGVLCRFLRDEKSASFCPLRCLFY
jgi:hypothetical protein